MRDIPPLTIQNRYFNLSGLPSIEGTEISLVSSAYIPVDADGIPTTTTLKPYPGVTSNETFTLGPVQPDIDDCFVVDPENLAIPLDTRASPLTRLVAAFHPSTGVHFEVLSTEPAFQFYTGKYINVPAVGELPERAPRSGFCVEPSRYVNAINEEKWRSQVVLKKGEVYGSRIVYRGWSDKE
jgi:aldose 1-epimerase